jgi:two-component system, chemotaxis family, response regulator PixH
MATALIVEDSLTDRDLLTRYLQQSGITVTSAQSSEEALKMLQLDPPDLVFLDVVLPGQSGFEFCRDLKTNESTQNIPVIICSTKGTEADKLWGSMLGADAYLTKPVNPQQLTQTVEQLIATSPKH